MSLTELTFCELDSSIELTNFDCGKSDLNEFLHKDSLDFQSELMAKTFLFCKEKEIIAFFSISNDNLSDKGDRPSWNKLSRKIPNLKRRREYPAVKIGRLGVSNKIQSAGLGKEILHFIIGITLFENKSAARFLIVDAYNNERTLNFYQRNNFQFLLGQVDKDKETRIMFLDLMPYIKAMQ